MSVKNAVSAETEGSLYWMAPEVLNGGAATTKSDVYAFGITLWEIFSRQDPYAGANPLAVASRVRTDATYRPTIPPSVPTAVGMLIKACWAHDPVDRPAMKDVHKTLEGLMSNNAAHGSSRSVSQARAKAPTGDVTLLFSDVENSTVLWDEVPLLMRDALAVHNRIIRSLMQKHSGYEVKTEGDSFMIAFATVRAAVTFATEVQVALLNADWPEALLQHSAAALQRDLSTQKLLYRGLRVRMGIHAGKPHCQLDVTTRRFDYLGPDVNKAARIEGLARGGQILVSSAVVKGLGAAAHSATYSVITAGTVKLKGINEPETVSSIVPADIQRVFLHLDDGAHSGSRSKFASSGASTNWGTAPQLNKKGDKEGEDYHDKVTNMMATNRWLIKFDEIQLGQVIGMGSYGEVIHTYPPFVSPFEQGKNMKGKKKKKNQ